MPRDGTIAAPGNGAAFYFRSRRPCVARIAQRIFRDLDRGLLRGRRCLLCGDVSGIVQQISILFDHLVGCGE
jgi:hypothetical protein